MAVDLKKLNEFMRKGWSWEGSGGSSGSSVQPNWNQNDSAAADYVKNRTHWAETTTTTLVEDVAVATKNHSATNNAFEIDDFVVGDSYMVTWDGNDYECISYEADGLPCIGNASLGGMSGGNNEPFLIGAMQGSAVVIAKSGTHIVSVRHVEEFVKTIDPKFLSLDAADWNQNDPAASDYIKNRTHWATRTAAYDIIDYEHSFNNYGESVSGVTLSNGAPPYFLVENFTGFIIGSRYLVVWDGVEYECVAREMARNGYTYVGIGNAKLWTGVAADDTTEPFLFTSGGTATTVYTPIGGEFGYEETHSFKVSTTQGEIVHPLDPKYIPEDYINSLIDTKLGVIENGTY